MICIFSVFRFKQDRIILFLCIALYFSCNKYIMLMKGVILWLSQQQVILVSVWTVISKLLLKHFMKNLA